jgi:hypothetical protein
MEKNMKESNKRKKDGGDGEERELERRSRYM